MKRDQTVESAQSEEYRAQSGEYRVQSGEYRAQSKGHNVPSQKQQTLSDIEILDVFSAYQTDLVKYAYHFIHDFNQAEDIVQEAYIRFQTKMRAAGNSTLNLKGFLNLLVRNLAIDLQRRKSFERKLFPEDVINIADLIPENRTSLENAVIAADELNRVMAALDTIPTRTRTALEMHRIGDYTMSEIAQHFSISKSMATHLVAQGMIVCRRIRAQH